MRPSKRLAGNLAAAAAFVNTNILYEIVPVFGAAGVNARIKTAGAGGTIDIVFVGPDFDQNQAAATAYAALTGTKYTTGNPTQVAVVAGTEALIQSDCIGDGYAIIKFTATGTGTITYCDVSCT